MNKVYSSLCIIIIIIISLILVVSLSFSLGGDNLPQSVQESNPGNFECLCHKSFFEQVKPGWLIQAFSLLQCRLQLRVRMRVLESQLSAKFSPISQLSAKLLAISQPTVNLK